MNKYVYINKFNGQKIYSDEPIDPPLDFMLIRQVRDTNIKKQSVIKKIITKLWQQQ